jgi:sarcosine oxidase
MQVSFKAVWSERQTQPQDRSRLRSMSMRISALGFDVRRRCGKLQSMHPDVIVVGQGAMGAAAICQLARRGAKVLGIDRFAPRHINGSSHGLTRITRLAVGEGAEYLPLVRRSHELWREIESITGRQLMRQTGGLVIGRLAGGASLHGQADFVASTLAVARTGGIGHEELDAKSVRERWPQFVLNENERACYEPSAGVLFPEDCIEAQLVLAGRAGAKLLTGQSVLSITREGPALVVQTTQGRHRAPQVLVTAGAWTASLLGGNWPKRLRVQRQTLHWLRPHAAQASLFAPERCPIFIWAHGASHEDAFYGVPLADSTGGVKIGTQQYDTDTAPDALDRKVAVGETTAVFDRHVQGRIPALSTERVGAAACMYTVATGARFIVERDEQLEGLSVVSACSGHGFKHSAALGEALAAQLLEGRSAVDLTPFGWR